MISNYNIVFVALMKHHVLKNYLYKFQWVGLFWIVVSVFIGGSSALLVSLMSSDVTADDDRVSSVTDTLVGIFLVIAGTILDAVGVLLEEKLLKSNVPVPPLLFSGIMGLWGVVLSIFVLFPVG
jgi:drug/metabolite transporter (DMT)-like permease